jgi:hypothetical protein
MRPCVATEPYICLSGSLWQLVLEASPSFASSSRGGGIGKTGTIIQTDPLPTRLVTARFSARSARAAGARCTARAIRSWAALSRRRFCPPSASGRPSAAPVRPRGANARLTQRPRRRQGGRPPVRARMSPDGVWSSRGIRPRSQTSRRPEESQPLMFAPRAAVMLHHIDRRFLPAEHRW